MSDDTYTFSAMWGHELLDSGFLQAPNLLVRFYKELGMTNGEFALVLQILSHKYDGRDPYPSQDLLAAYQNVSDTRHIRRMIDSLEKKGLVVVGVRKDAKGRRLHNLYNFAPLVAKLKEKALELEAGSAIADKENETILWRKKTQGENGPVDLNPADQNSPVDADQFDPRQGDQIDPGGQGGNHPPNKTKQKTNELNTNNKQESVVVDVMNAIGKIEQTLGTTLSQSDRSIVKKWLNQHMLEQLLDWAAYAATNADESVVGYFKKAVKGEWATRPAVPVTGPKERDPRYPAFYALYPDE